ncbi:MAG TPA: DNA polymerase III subunit alpha, partial [Candidatus Saccharimonadia bacterium]|nr:DNA polymerase III subunit alpha [Candidatus Saccharimonadia bacterium]
LTDSTIRVAELVEAVRLAGMPAVALTDDSNLFALVKFYKAAENAGLKPIIGSDVWIGDAKVSHRLTLLCADRVGYNNLSVLLSRAYRERQGERVLLQREWFEERSAGLIALAGSHSDVGRYVLAGRDEAAREALAYWHRCFGDRLYLELTRLRHAEDDHFVAAALELAQLADLPAVATNDVRFLARDDFEAHEARVCIHEGYALNDPKRPRIYTEEQYLKSPAEMHALFADLGPALENAVELAKRCNLELSFGKSVLPAFPTPNREDEPSYLKSLAQQGLDERLETRGPAPKFARAQYDERLASELDVIVAMGFPGYFLIVADFINWAKRNDIPVGPGRGSGAGSLVAYALGITDLDPLRYDLLFERFLNPERVSMPDFDIDFCMDRRDEVIDYVTRTYGRDRVSQIITYGTMAAKAVLRDTGRVLGMPYGYVDKIAKTIPARPLDLSLDDALGVSEKSRKEPERVSADFKAMYETEDDVRQLVDLARKLEDLTRNAGKHAGGVVIAPSALTDFAPLYSEARGDSVVTQFDKDDVEAIGLVKFDFLGLRTLTIIDWAVKAINAKRKTGSEYLSAPGTQQDDAVGSERYSDPVFRPPLDIAKLPMDDAATYALLKTCRTTAIFQLESRGMKELVRKLQPDTFEDIIALVALFRPGPLQSGMVDDFIARKHGRQRVEYPHAKLEPILRPTYGVIVYQEQVMQIAQVLAGYTLGGADLLRRAMGKKKPEEMAKERVKFETGAESAGVDARRASAIFDLMEKFAEYGFNKSHSAAYALVSYQTAWLKAHYPAEFMAAVLSSDMDNTDKVVHILDDARALGLDVRRPDVNAGAFMFTAMDPKSIRYGLGAVKGAGHAAIDGLVAERDRGGPYRSLLDLCQRVDLQRTGKRVLEALILAGALDSLAGNRATLMAQLPEAMKAAEQQLREREAGQDSLFGGGSSLAVSSQVELPVVPEWPLLQRLNGERDTLGHYLSGHPTDACRDWLAQLASCLVGAADEYYKPNAQPDRRGRVETPATLAGLVGNIRRRGDQMAFIQLEDGSGRIEVSFFREAFSDCAPLLTKDNVIVVEGALSLDEFSGQIVLRARRAWTLGEAVERFAKRVQLRLNGVREDFAERLSAQLAPHRGGNTPIRLSYVNAGAASELDLGDAWKVRASPTLIENLRAVPGVLAADLTLGRATS